MILSSERPQEWQAVYDSVKRGGYSGPDGRAETIYADSEVFDACQSFAEQRAACQSQAVKPSQDKAFALDAYDQAKGRLRQLDPLMGQIDKTVPLLNRYGIRAAT